MSSTTSMVEWSIYSIPRNLLGPKSVRSCCQSLPFIQSIIGELMSSVGSSLGITRTASVAIRVIALVLVY
ncbi:hypothetical protein Tco_0555925 [Tanacetum coccineum]